MPTNLKSPAKPKRKKPPSKTSKPLSFRVGVALPAHLDEAAKLIGVTRNRLVVLVLRHYLSLSEADRPNVLKGTVDDPDSIFA